VKVTVVAEQFRAGRDIQVLWIADVAGLDFKLEIGAFVVIGACPHHVDFCRVTILVNPGDGRDVAVERGVGWKWNEVFRFEHLDTPYEEQCIRALDYNISNYCQFS
jgi:hypothetical protein